MKTTAVQTRLLAANIFAVALLAALSEQVVHEGVHAMAAWLAGAQVTDFHFWAMDHVWPADQTGPPWAEGVIAGSAAVVDIVIAIGCIILFARPSLPPTIRLFLLYAGGFSLFSGFGYLLVDPLFANQDSVGDWAKVVMLLGGGWDVRVPVTLIGAAGTIAGYFWLGRAALHIQIPQVSRTRAGLITCIFPYLGICLIFSLLAIWHPAGNTGVIAALMKFWMGYSGFFWAFMIVFVWDRYEAPISQCLAVNNRPHWPSIVLSLLGLAASLLWLISYPI